MEEAEVTPDENGRWLYRFTAPKYDADGKEIDYTLEELPPESFRPDYNGFDIVNTYIPPVTVTLPSVVKAVEGDEPPEERFTFCMTAQYGAPMPEGTSSRFLTVQLTGSGEAPLGTIRYTKAGTYRYTVTEIADDTSGWAYDPAVYTITVTVVEENGALRADTVITRDGTPAGSLTFVNRYDGGLPPQVTTVIAGQKIWRHGTNPEEKRPDAIVVLVYADGTLVLQQQVTAENNWRYRFELPKYNDAGKEILYTVDEAEVEHYDKAVEGYDLVNTYHPDSPLDSGGPDESPQTGDNSHLGLWIFLLIASFCGLIVTTRRRRKTDRR